MKYTDTTPTEFNGVKYLTVSQFAVLAGVWPSAVSAACRKRSPECSRIFCIRIGGRPLIPMSELERFNRSKTFTKSQRIKYAETASGVLLGRGVPLDNPIVTPENNDELLEAIAEQQGSAAAQAQPCAPQLAPAAQQGEADEL